MRVTIVTEWGESLPSYELRRDQPLDRQIDLICQQVKASGNKEKYALFVESTLQYVTEAVRAQYLLQILLLVYQRWCFLLQHLADMDWVLPEGASICLKLRPDIMAETAVQSLNTGDAEAKRKVLTMMKGCIGVCL